MKKIQRHKHHFQLLELMVAAFILLICIAPTMRIFTSIYQSQQEIIRQNQRDHLVHAAHAKITELLYKRQLIFEENTQSKPIEISDPKLAKLLHKFSFSLEGSLQILESYTPKEAKFPTKYLAKLIIKVKDLAYRPQNKSINQNIENQDPSESFYDYYVYIDSGEKDKKQEKILDQNPTDNNISLEPNPENNIDAKRRTKTKEMPR